MKRGLNRIKELHGNPHDLIPELVNQLGQHRTAARLGVSAFTINRWLRTNGYVKRVRIEYFRPESEERAS